MTDDELDAFGTKLGDVLRPLGWEDGGDGKTWRPNATAGWVRSRDLLPLVRLFARATAAMTLAAIPPHGTA